MKSKIIKIAVPVLAAVALICAILAVCLSGGGGETKELSAYYGETFRLPYSNGKYTVRNADNALVDISADNGFFVDRTDDYAATLNENGKKTEYVIKVEPGDFILQRLSFDKRYVAVNAPAKLPSVYSVDKSGKNVGYTAKLFNEKNEEIPFDGDEFTPTATGSYTFVVTSSFKGKTKQAECLFEVVEETSEKLDLIAELGEKYGVENQVANPIGGRLVYTTEKSYGKDSGSMKFEFNLDYLTDQQFSLKKLFINDVTGTDGIYFYVYNDSDYALQISINYGDWANIKPRCWNKVVFKDKNGWTTADGTLFEENFELDNIDGLTIASFDEKWSCAARYDLYFSSVYALYPVDLDEFAARLEKFPTALNDDNIDEFYAVNEIHAELDDEQRETVATKWEKICSAYGKYLAAKCGETNAKKLIAFDKSVGAEQVTLLDGNDIYFDAKTAYGSESGSTVVKSSLWGAQVRIEFPFFTDCSGFGELYFYVYVDSPASAKSFYLDFYGAETVTTDLSAGEWVRVSVPLEKAINGAGNVLDASFSFYCGNWEEIADGTTFKMSAMYVA